MDKSGSGGLLELITEKTNIASPKQLTIRNISAQEACRLNGLWHSRLPVLHWSNVVRNKNYMCFAAECNNYVYAVGIWSSPATRMICNKTVLELRRLAICEEAPRNTATYMMAKMVKQIKLKLPHIKTLISYQDTAVHVGTIYKAANWIPAYQSKGHEWNWSGRERTKCQSAADKIRWEYKIRKTDRQGGGE